MITKTARLSRRTTLLAGVGFALGAGVGRAFAQPATEDKRIPENEAYWARMGVSLAGKTVLVNNAAAVSGDERQTSADGHELAFAVNYLAHFVLTYRLLPLLEASAPARIVNVSSMGQTPIDFADVMMERSYNPADAYRRSKR